MEFKDIRETFKTVREELNRPILDKRVVEQAQEIGRQANETLKKIEDREIVELVIKHHEADAYVKDGYEIIRKKVRTEGGGERKAVKLCYRDKEDKTLVILSGYVNVKETPRVVEYKYMYVGHEMIKDMYKAIEGEGKV